MLISIPNLIVNLARVNSTTSRNSGVTFSLPHRIRCHSLWAVVDRGSPGTAGYKKIQWLQIMKLNESLHSHSFILKRFVSCKLYAASNSNIQTYSNNLFSWTDHCGWRVWDAFSAAGPAAPQSDPELTPSDRPHSMVLGHLQPINCAQSKTVHQIQAESLSALASQDGLACLQAAFQSNCKHRPYTENTSKSMERGA